MENIFVDMIAALLQLIWTVVKAFSPVIIGLVLAYLLSGPAEWIRLRLFKPSGELLGQNSPKGRVPSIIITYLLVLIILLLIIYAFVILILGALPSESLHDTIREVYDYFNSVTPISQWLEEKFSLERVAEMLSSFVGNVVNFFIGVVASIYLLKDKEFFLTLWQKFLSLVLKQRIHGQINETISDINLVLTTFLKGAFVDSMIVALLSSIVLSVLKVRFAVIIGILGGLLNIIPYFGPFLGMIPAVLVAFFSGGIWKSIAVVIALLIIQQLDSNYIYPKVVGSSIGLHPLFVLIAVTIFGHFGGIIGMLLAVPSAGILQVLIKKWAYSR